MLTDTYPTTEAVSDTDGLRKCVIAFRALQRETRPADPSYVDGDKTSDSPLSDADIGTLIKAIEMMLATVRMETSAESQVLRLSDFPVADDDAEDDTWAPIPPNIFQMKVRRVFQPPQAFRVSDAEDDSSLE